MERPLHILKGGVELQPILDISNPQPSTPSMTTTQDLGTQISSTLLPQHGQMMSRR
jgi:hypothetical protein